MALGILASWPDERLRRLLVNLKLPVELNGVSAEVITQRVLRSLAPGQPLTLVELDAVNQPRITFVVADVAEATLLGKVRTLFPEHEAATP